MRRMTASDHPSGPEMWTTSVSPWSSRCSVAIRAPRTLSMATVETPSSPFSEVRTSTVGTLWPTATAISTVGSWPPRITTPSTSKGAMSERSRPSGEYA